MSQIVEKKFYVNRKTKRFCFYRVERVGFKYQFTSYDKRPLSEVGIAEFSWHIKTEFSNRNTQLIDEKIELYVSSIRKTNYELIEYADLIELGLGIDYEAANNDNTVLQRITTGEDYIDTHYYEQAIVYANRVDIVTGYVNAFWVSSNDLKKRLEAELDSDESHIGIYNLSLKTVFIKKQSQLKKTLDAVLREREVDIPDGIESVLDAAISQYHKQQAKDARFFDLLGKSAYQLKNTIYDDFSEYRLCIHDGDLTVDRDVLIDSSRHRRFPQYEEIILITGDLTINGTLFINENPAEKLKGKVIVLGEISVQNFIDGTQLHLEYGKLKVDGLAYIKYPMIRCEGMSVECPTVLTGEHRDNFSEIKSVMPLALLREDIKLIDGIKLDDGKINVDFLTENIVAGRSIFSGGFDVKGSLTKLEQEEIELELPRSIEKFTDWLRQTYYYPETFCGAEQVAVEDDDITGAELYPDGGDSVYYDHRCHDGFIGLSHDGGESTYIKLKKSKLRELNIAQEPSRQRAINTLELITRYESFGYLFSDWAGSDIVTLGFDSEADLQTSYEAEFDSLSDDEHLALYWVLVFTMLADHQKFLKVAQKLKNSQSKLVQSGIAFCKSLDLFTDIEIKSDVPSDMFRRRRAYLLWNYYSYQTISDCVHRWWDSYRIYPLPELYLVCRARWLKVNLDKFNRWPDFNALEKGDENETSCLFSYLICCNPKTESEAKALAAHNFIQEINEHFEIWNDPISKTFVISMLFDVHTHLADQALLITTVERYIDGCDRNQTIDEKYHAMLAFISDDGNEQSSNGAVQKIDESKRAAEQMQILTGLDGIDEFSPQNSKEAFSKMYRMVEPYLASYDCLFIAELTKRIERQTSDRNLLQMLFVYLYRNPELENRQNLALDTWQRLSLSDHDIPRMFSEFPKLIHGEGDPNIELVKLLITESAHDEFQNPANAAVMFFLDVFANSTVFDFASELINNSPHKGTHEAIFTKLLSREYESKINPSLDLSKTQMNTLLDACWDYLGCHDYVNDPNANCVQEAVSVFYDCENRQAREWFENKLSDQKALQEFFSFDGAFHVRSDAIEALENGLSRIK